ncbi:MAG: prepilin peptidase [Candidatus Sulfobium sp.]|jgi:leader peptidase (prepilin peptidase)/N-methyltransferase
MVPYVIVCAFGAVIGSFLNVCIYRIPRKQSIVFPSSRCPSCDTPIKAWDNIPVLSYVLLRGKCRSCREKISLRYPLVETLNAFLYAAALWRYGMGWDFVIYCVLLSALIVITFIDLDFLIIPDRITLAGIPLGLAAGCFILPDPFMRASLLGYRASIIGALGGFIFYFLMAELSIRLFRKEGMGGGDIKMMAMIGAFMGWKAVILTTFAGSLLGSLGGITFMIAKGKGRGTLIPFGPFLALGTLITLFFGQEILMWYLH